VLAQLLIVASVWVRVDLNEELADLPPARPLPRRCSTCGCAQRARPAGGGPPERLPALSCLWGQLDSSRCQGLVEGTPEAPSSWFARVFAFRLRGRSHCDPHGRSSAMWLGGLCVGLLQWRLVRFPRAKAGGGEF